MGTLVAVEGLDGAGKRTLVDRLSGVLRERGARVATLAFPRYGESLPADLAAEALRGGHGDLAGSVSGMALLFALDRRAAREDIERLRRDNDWVLLDRYVASNAAYSAARSGQGADGEIVRWVGDLEYGRCGLPRPDWQILLHVPPRIAQDRARGRSIVEAHRDLDAYERDTALQHATANVYRELAQRDWFGSWWVLGSRDDPVELLDQLIGLDSREPNHAGPGVADSYEPRR